VLTNVRYHTIDLVLIGTMTVLALVTAAQAADGGEQTWALVVAASTVAPLALRLRFPVLSTVLILLGLLTYSLMGYGEYLNGGGGLIIAMFSVVLLRPRPVAFLLWAASAAVTAVMFFTTGYDLPWSWAVQAPLTVLAGGYLLGELTKHWAERTERLAREAERAAARERVALARELHDVVAHHMSVVSMHAGVAEQALEHDPAAARIAIATAGNSSREALAEMRRLLMLLRPPEADGAADAAADDAPTPGLALLDELADRVRGAGVPVEITVTGRPRALSPGPDLCAYRVAQESLTNVVKHAGPATARVCIDYGEEVLTLTISDTGAGPGNAKSPDASHGLLGMRERAELYGGSLIAGPGNDGGFEVMLSLPIGEAT
jgi:signal transduction histidine kinase